MIKNRYRIKRRRKHKKKRGRDIFGDGFKSFYSIGKAWHKSVKWDEKKNNAMVKLNVPKRVTLPNGRSFVARYKKIPRGAKCSYEENLYSKSCVKR